MTKTLSTAERIKLVEAANGSGFLMQVRAAGLDPALHFRFANLSNIPFANCNLDGFDFTGARLINCDFVGAKLCGARLDRAIIDTARPNSTAINTERTNFRKALDWDAYVTGWRVANADVQNINGAETIFDDMHLRVAHVFSDAPFAPEMVVARGNTKGVPTAAISRFNVTFDEWDFSQSHPNWAAITKLTPQLPLAPWGRGRQPVVNVSWHDAAAYASWLSAVTGFQYFLLDVASWEHFAEVDTDIVTTTEKESTKYGRHSRSILGDVDGTVEVGSFRSNTAGIFDLAGNVWEWCSDQRLGTESGRLIRGGSWKYFDRHNRGWLQSTSRKHDAGIRVARLIGGQPSLQARNEKYNDHRLRDYIQKADLYAPAGGVHKKRRKHGAPPKPVTSDSSVVLQGTLRILSTIAAWKKPSVLALDDGRLLSWGEGRTLKIWPTDGQPIAIKLAGHQGKVIGATKLDEGRILSWSEDETLRIWSGEGESIAVLRGHSGWIHGARQCANGRILSWGEDRTTRIWSSTGEIISELLGHRDLVIGAVDQPNGQILSWGRDEQLLAWQADGTPAFIDDVRAAAVLGDGRLLTWGTDHKTLKLQKPGTLQFAVMSGASDWVRGARNLTNGDVLSWSRDRVLRRWTDEGILVVELKGHVNRIVGACELRDGRLLSWSTDKTLRVWNDHVCQAVLTGHEHHLVGAIELRDGRIVSWSHDSCLRIWSAAGEPITLLQHQSVGLHKVIQHATVPDHLWVVNDHGIQLIVCEAAKRPDFPTAAEHTAYLSISRSDLALASELSKRLSQRGVRVQLGDGYNLGERAETSIVRVGEDYHHGERWDVVAAKLILDATAVVLLLSPTSIRSEWMLSEGKRALALNKLVLVRTPDLNVGQIPIDFASLFCCEINDVHQIEVAIRSADPGWVPE